jgi:hypothetical protein
MIRTDVATTMCQLGAADIASLGEDYLYRDGRSNLPGG